MKIIVTETFVQGRLYKGGQSYDVSKEQIEKFRASGQIKRVKVLGVMPVKKAEQPAAEPAKEKPAKKKAAEKPET